jgi:hypothetical protein
MGGSHPPSMLGTDPGLLLPPQLSGNIVPVEQCGSRRNVVAIGHDRYAIKAPLKGVLERTEGANFGDAVLVKRKKELKNESNQTKLMRLISNVLN